jgi:hypothetical protein
MKVGSPEPPSEIIDGRMFLFRRLRPLPKFPEQEHIPSSGGSSGSLPDLAVDAVIGANLMGNEVNSKRSAQPSGWNRTIEVTILFRSDNHLIFN